MTASEASEVHFRLLDVNCTSASCNRVLERHLGDAKGIVEFYVNPMDSMLTVHYNPLRTTPEEVASVVQTTGFKTIGPIMARVDSSNNMPRSPPTGGG